MRALPSRHEAVSASDCTVLTGRISLHPRLMCQLLGMLSAPYACEVLSERTIRRVIDALGEGHRLSLSPLSSLRST